MWDLLALAISPAFFVGIVFGLLVAVGFHHLAPAGIDAASAGAWFVGVGGVIGLLWNFIFGSRKK
jgi:hypothetical protein